MAFRNFAKGLKNFFGPNNRFFNGAREGEDAGNDYYAPQGAASRAQEYAPPQSYQPPQAAPYGQQPGFAQQGYAGYQQPQQPAYQQPASPYPPQSGYQQAPAQEYAAYQQSPAQEYGGFQQQTVNQAYVPPRNRRSVQHAPARENVVPFPGAAAPQQQMQPQAAAAPQAAPAAEQKKPSACVINVRNISDCRSAIGILRAGDCVIAVIDSIADQSEVRRYVDTLNGACFSLGCTMTRTSSRVGVYFLAPVGMQVLTDQTTTQMNAQSRAPQRPRSAQPMFQSAAPQTPYAARPGFSPYTPPQQSPVSPQPQYSAAQQPAYSQQPQTAYAPQEPAQSYTPDQQNGDYSQEATL